MTRVLVTFLAVLSLSVGVASSVATVSDARSGANQPKITRGSGEHEDKDHEDKDKDKEKCDDDRGKSSTPKACHDDREHSKEHSEHGD